MDNSEKRNHMAIEASAGLTFSNVLLGIGLGLTGLVVANSPDQGTLKLALYSTLVTFSAFFATIFFANIHGAIRNENPAAYNKALLWGNAFTEYLGVFLVCALFPIFVFVYTGDKMAARIVAGIVISGFLIYQFSGFDLLSRFAPKVPHAIMSIIFSALIYVDLECLIRLEENKSLITSLLIVLFCCCLVLTDLKVMEKKLREKIINKVKPSL